MKIIEFTKNINIAITNDEADLLCRFDDDTPVMSKRDMTEQQLHMANQLVNKDLLLRKNENGQITYKRRAR